MGKQLSWRATVVLGIVLALSQFVADDIDNGHGPFSAIISVLFVLTLLYASFITSFRGGNIAGGSFLAGIIGCIDATTVLFILALLKSHSISSFVDLAAFAVFGIFASGLAGMLIGIVGTIAGKVWLRRVLRSQMKKRMA